TDGRPDRPALTSIYFLLPGGACSRWHRVLSDEAWHLYEGDPLELYWAGDGDNFSDVTARLLGPIQTDGAAMRPVTVVPRNRWQAARSTGSYSLVGCSVGPGFDFADFELLTQRPDLVERLTNARPDLARFL